MPATSECPVVLACHLLSGYRSASPAEGDKFPSAGLSAGQLDDDPVWPAAGAYLFRQYPVFERHLTPERSGRLRQANPDRR